MAAGKNGRLAPQRRAGLGAADTVLARESGEIEKDCENKSDSNDRRGAN